MSLPYRLRKGMIVDKGRKSHLALRVRQSKRPKDSTYKALKKETDESHLARLRNTCRSQYKLQLMNRYRLYPGYYNRRRRIGVSERRSWKEKKKNDCLTAGHVKLETLLVDMTDGIRDTRVRTWDSRLLQHTRIQRYYQSQCFHQPGNQGYNESTKPYTRSISVFCNCNASPNIDIKKLLKFLDRLIFADRGSHPDPLVIAGDFNA